ncbi:hypothetical protein FRB97_000125 [Tulasnella sp. 331]|nr:hypothetical protein FRB97_000125 [Tulasnella sp. 331]
MYMDPTLQIHMGPQGPSMAGRSILDFVHPDEVDSARRDLSRVSQNKEINGSVTRVRFLRLSVIRLEFGATTRDIGSFPGVTNIIYDENYLTADLVINWVAEGVVLCFIHAIMDLSDNDNDAKSKTPWTNWCRTQLMDDRHCEALYRSVATPALSHPPGYERQKYPANPENRALISTEPVSPLTSHTSHDRVFQIVKNDEHRPTLFSWPPLSTPEVGALVGGAAMGMTDLEAAEFSRLARKIPISDAAAVAAEGESAQSSENRSGKTGMQVPPRSRTELFARHAQTSCTSRFIHVEDTFEIPGRNGIGRRVECVYIPHGAIIFACYKIVAGPVVQKQIQQPQQIGYYPIPGPAGGVKTHQQYQYNQPYPTHPYPEPQTLPHAPAWGPPSPHQIYTGPEDGGPPLHSVSHTYPQQYQPQPRYQPQPHADKNHAYPSQSSTTSSITPPTPGATEGVTRPEIRPPLNGREQPQQQAPSQGRPTWTSGPPAWNGGPGADGATSAPALQPPAHITAPSSAPVDGSFNQYSSNQYQQPPSHSYASVPYDQHPYAPAIPSPTRPIRSQSHSTVPNPSGGELYYSPHGHYAPPYPYNPLQPVQNGGTTSPFPRESSGEEGSAVHNGRHDEYAIDNQHYGGANGAQYAPPDASTSARYNQRDGMAPQSPPPLMGSPTHPLIPKEREPCGARVGGVPPPGVTQCISCSTTNSPEWRKGASGKKDLCNACGLRFARSRQKLEGKHPQRRVRRDQIGFTPTSPSAAPIRTPKKVRGGAAARRATVSSGVPGDSSDAAQMRDGSQSWDPYMEDPPQGGPPGTDGEEYHLQHQPHHSGEGSATYRRTSYDRSDRYIPAMDLPQHLGGGLAPPHPSEYGYPLTPTASDGGARR